MKIQRTTINKQTLRVEGDASEVKFSVLDGAAAHYRGIAKLGFGDAADITLELVQFLYGPTARIVVDDA